MNTERFKVLIVEEDLETRERLVDIFEKEGYQTLLATSGQEGLVLFEKEHPPIGVIDINLPDMKGMELMRTLKKSAPETQIILIAGYADYDLALSALRELAVDMIKKPLNLEETKVALGHAQERFLQIRQIHIKPVLLVCEDDEITLEKLSSILNRRGYEVLGARDGQEGLDIFNTRKVDIALLDMRMPRINGVDLLNQMKQITTDCEVIMITGFADEDTVIQSMRGGASNFLRKPVDIDELIFAVSQALERLNLRRALMYRQRELDLAKAVMIKITEEKWIIVYMDREERKKAMEFGEQLLSFISLPLMVSDRDLNPIFFNALFKEKAMSEGKSHWIDNLPSLGLGGLSPISLREIIQETLSNAAGIIKRVEIGKYAYIALTKIHIVEKNKEKECVLMVFRGERQP